jgi:hypothetical protein
MEPTVETTEAFKPEVGKLISGLSYEMYDAIDALRSGDLYELYRSPRHYLLSKTNKKEPTDAMKAGSLVHLALQIGPELLKKMKRVPVFVGKTKDGRDSTQSAEAREAKKNWLAAQPSDAVFVSEEEERMLIGVLEAISSHRLLGKMLMGGVRETSLVVEDPETGVKLKCRPDFISKEGFLVDFKTSIDARPGHMTNAIFSNHPRSPWYALQAAHYVHCLRVAGISKSEASTIVAIEKEPPYGIMIYPLDMGCLAPAEQWRAMLTKRYAECLKVNIWPSYPERAIPVTVPEWVSVPDFDEE